jgi:hypothetical protein
VNKYFKNKCIQLFAGDLISARFAFRFQASSFALRNGRLAQLVQSTSFTPRGSGVRIPQRPLFFTQTVTSGFFYALILVMRTGGFEIVVKQRFTSGFEVKFFQT